MAGYDIGSQPFLWLDKIIQIIIMRIFKSRFDASIFFILSLAGIVVVVAGVVSPSISIWGCILFNVAFVVYVFCSLRYVVDQNTLTVSMFCFQRAIPLSQISRAERVTCSTPAPAFSSRRLRIYFGHFKEFIDVSPKDEEGFLDAIGISVD